MTEAKKERALVSKVKALSKVRTWMVAVAVFMSVLRIDVCIATTQSSRSMFGSSNAAKAHPCRVIKPDLSYKLSLDLLQKWRFNTDDQGYPMGTVVVSFLYYDDTADDDVDSLSILLEEKDSYNKMQLMPVKGYANNKGESLWEAAVRYGKQVMPSLDENDLHLLNAVHTENPRDPSKEPDKVLYTSFVVFVSDKSVIKTIGTREWYYMVYGYLFTDDDEKISSDDIWFITKEDMLSIYQFVDCPRHPANLPDIPEPAIIPDPTEEDKMKQLRFYREWGCMIDGDKILYRGNNGREMQRQCHHALMYEMKRVCGDKFAVDYASKVRCLIHGARSKYQWKMPRKSTLNTEPELWGVSILDSYEYAFQFGWLFHYTFLDDSKYGGMVAILEVTKPNSCHYLEQFDEVRRDTDKVDHAVVRYSYSMSYKTYPNIENDLVPDAWIYTSTAANNCGLRLLKQYYFQPQPVVKCKVEPLLLDQLSKTEGYRGNKFCVFPLNWDESKKSLSFVAKKGTNTVIMCGDNEGSGHNTRRSAVALADVFHGWRLIFKQRDGARLLGAYKVRNVPDAIRSVFGFFLEKKEKMDDWEWLDITQLDATKVSSKMEIKKAKQMLENIKC